MTSGRLVYSTETGRVCPECSKPVAQCICRTKSTPAVAPGNVRVSRERRNGKAVTVIKGLPLDALALTQFGKQLRASFGTGGTVKDGTVELQGDHCDAVLAMLKEQGHAPKRSGG